METRRLGRQRRFTRSEIDCIREWYRLRPDRSRLTLIAKVYNITESTVRHVVEGKLKGKDEP